jgi:hypothetical protein
MNASDEIASFEAVLSLMKRTLDAEALIKGQPWKRSIPHNI